MFNKFKTNFIDNDKTKFNDIETFDFFKDTFEVSRG